MTFHRPLLAVTSDFTTAGFFIPFLSVTRRRALTSRSPFFGRRGRKMSGLPPLRGRMTAPAGKHRIGASKDYANRFVESRLYCPRFSTCATCSKTCSRVGPLKFLEPGSPGGEDVHIRPPAVKCRRRPPRTFPLVPARNLQGQRHPASYARSRRYRSHRTHPGA